MPKPMWSPPNASAMRTLLHANGVNTAIAPATTKQSPITGTMRTENAPPVMTPVPYSISHIPGRTVIRFAWYMAAVSTAPTTIGGTKLVANLRPGPERSGMRAARALRPIAHPEMTTESSASPSQMASHSVKEARLAANAAAPMADAPTATMPHPDTAVNAPARSIVSRMNSRLSIARACSAGGSPEGGAESGRPEAIGTKLGPRDPVCQVLYDVKSSRSRGIRSARTRFAQAPHHGLTSRSVSTTLRHAQHARLRGTKGRRPHPPHPLRLPPPRRADPQHRPIAQPPT